MSSFVNKNVRAFDQAEADQSSVAVKRSEGRMKSYFSAIDSRSWSDECDERRNYILELIQRDYKGSSSFGKFIPVEALINCLLSDKIKKIKQLEAENKRLKRSVCPRGTSSKDAGTKTEGSAEGVAEKAVKMLEDIHMIVDCTKPVSGSLSARFANCCSLPGKVRALKKQSKGDDDCGGTQTQGSCTCSSGKGGDKSAEACLKQLARDLQKCTNENCALNTKLCKVQTELDNQLCKIKEADRIINENAQLKAYIETIKEIEKENRELKCKVQRADKIEQERELLMKEIMDCECCMSSQENEIKKLACHIDCLTQDLDKRQDEMKVKVCKLRIDLEKKDQLIANSEQKLCDVQQQLRQSIDGLSCETVCLRKRLEELQFQRAQDKEEINNKNREICKLDKLYKEKVEIEKDLSKKLIKMEELEIELEHCKQENMRLKELYEDTQNQLSDEQMKKVGDEHYKKVLKQTKCALRCLVEKIRRYEIGDGTDKLIIEELLNRVSHLEGELTEARDIIAQVKACGEAADTAAILEYRERVNSLEKELKAAYATIEMLKETACTCDDENGMLKNNAAGMQDMAKEAMQALEDELKACRGELLNKVADLEDQISCLQSLIAELREKLRTCQDENASLLEQLAELNNENKSLAGKVAQLERDIEERDAAHAACMEEKDALQQQIADCKAEIMNSLNKMANAEEMENLKRMLADLEQQLEDCKKASVPKGGDLATVVEDLATRLGLAEERIGALEDLLRGCVQETNCKAELEALKARLEEVLAELDKANESEAEWQEKLKAMQNELAQAKKDCEAALSKLKEDYEGEIKKLHAENAESLQRLQAEFEGKMKAMEEGYLKQLAAKEEELKIMADAMAQASLAQAAAAPPMEPPPPPPPPPVTEPVEIVQVEDANAQVDQGLDKGIGAGEGPPPPAPEPPEPPPPPPPPYPEVPPPPKVAPIPPPQEEEEEVCTCKALPAILPIGLPSSQTNVCKSTCGADKKPKCSKAPLIRPEKIESFNEGGSCPSGCTAKFSLVPSSCSYSCPGSARKASCGSCKQPLATARPPPVKDMPKPNKLKRQIPTQYESCKKCGGEKVVGTECSCCPPPPPCPPPCPPPSCPPPPCPPPTQPASGCACTPSLGNSLSSPGHMQGRSSLIGGRAVPICIPTRHISMGGQLRGGEERLACNDARGDQLNSIRKIAELENRLLAERKRTKEKADLLQETVTTFKRELEIEKQKNDDLINRYTNQSKMVANIMVEMNTMQQRQLLSNKKPFDTSCICPVSPQQRLGGGANQPPSPFPLSNRATSHFHTEVLRDKATSESVRRVYGSFPPPKNDHR